LQSDHKQDELHKQNALEPLMLDAVLPEKVSGFCGFLIRSDQMSCPAGLACKWTGMMNHCCCRHPLPEKTKERAEGT
jgi:hypothetical protein